VEGDVGVVVDVVPVVVVGVLPAVVVLTGVSFATPPWAARLEAPCVATRTTTTAASALIFRILSTLDRGSCLRNINDVVTYH
jgi:hypothetical protein